jgi:uncharacterized protein YbaA (DUF1428 family)
MPAYVDGFLLSVPQAKLDTYRKIAKKAGKVWMEYGALQYMECVGDDMDQKETASFPKTIKAKPGEVVVFSFIVFKSKADRNRVNAKVMADPRLKAMCDPNNMPFDCKRMNYGGFKSIVEA